METTSQKGDHEKFMEHFSEDQYRLHLVSKTLEPNPILACRAHSSRKHDHCIAQWSTKIVVRMEARTVRLHVWNAWGISLQFLESISYTSEDIRSIVLTRPKGMFGKTGFQIYVPFGTLILKLVAYGKLGPSFCKWWSSNPGCKGWTGWTWFLFPKLSCFKNIWNLKHLLFNIFFVVAPFSRPFEKGSLWWTLQHDITRILGIGASQSLHTLWEQPALSYSDQTGSIKPSFFFQHSLK